MRAGTPLDTRIDVLFNSDCAAWKHFLLSNWPSQLLPLWHPLVTRLTAWPTRLVYPLVLPLCGAEEAGSVTVRLVCALAAGLGAGALFAALVRRRGAAIPLLLLPAYLLGTSQVLVCLPEHFALSHGLLCASLAVVLTGWPLRRRLALLALLTVAAGGVTVTNSLYPLGAFLFLLLRASPGLSGLRAFAARHPRRVAVGSLLVAGALGAGGTAAGLAVLRRARDPRAEMLVGKIRGDLHGRLYRAPAASASYLLRGLIDPVIGPTPSLQADGRMVSYEPAGGRYKSYGFWPYDRLQGAAALGWLALLVGATCTALRSSATRGVALGLLAWLTFNGLLHNVWGDEFFLFSPHWSWALLGLVLLAVPPRASPWLVPLVTVLCAGQVHTLLAIRSQLALVAP